VLQSLKLHLKKWLPPHTLNWLYRIRVALLSYSATSYSQEGEDMILRRIFQDRETGFYVDIGAYHPKHLSNTYYFYQHGWRGINIDALPGSMILFNQMRPRDINIEAAVAEETGAHNFYVFNGRALNTFDQQLAAQRSSEDTYVVKTCKLQTRRLDDILTESLPSGERIQFMSVDVEGLDLPVLKSNDWSRFRPEYILVEIWDLELTSSLTHPIVEYLIAQDYLLVGKAYSTAFFQDRRHEQEQSVHQ